MKKHALLAAISTVAAALGGGCSADWRDSVQCRKHLKGIALTLDLERQMNSNAWPQSLIDVDHGLLRKILVCPATGNTPGRDQDAQKWSDYIYVDWSKTVSNRSSAGPKYPLAFDRRLSNHRGRGINVVLIDGSVFWDQGGNWLSNFAKAHPEFNVPTVDSETSPTSRGKR